MLASDVVEQQKEHSRIKRRRQAGRGEEEDANGAIRQEACSVEATFRALRAVCSLSLYSKRLQAGGESEQALIKRQAKE
jgi:hypothetical protein